MRDDEAFGFSFHYLTQTTYVVAEEPYVVAEEREFLPHADTMAAALNGWVAIDIIISRRK